MARGFQPRRPDAVVGTTQTGAIARPRIFRGRPRPSGHPGKPGCSSRTPTPSPLDAIPGRGRPVAEKRELFPGPRPPSPGSAASPPSVRSWVREGGPRFPFAARSWLPGSRPIDRFAAAAGGLGSTNSRASAVLEKPFSASALRVLAWVVATTTKIRTTGRSAPARARASPRPARLAYSAGLDLAPPAGFEDRARAPSIFGADPLGGYVFTRFLADFDFHDHRPAVATDRRPFRDRRSAVSGPFAPLPVHPESPVLLTKTGPPTVPLRARGPIGRPRASRPFGVRE